MEYGNEIWVLAGLSQIIGFYLPLAVILTMGVCMAVLVRRNHYQRKLSLRQSAEEKEIRRLMASGAVSREEGEKLLVNCRALPEVREESPLPDIHLRLVSAFGRIYSTMKFVLFCGRACGMIILIVPYSGKVNQKVDIKTENLTFLVIGAALFLGLAVFEFIASLRILRGSMWSRNFLVFSWILNLFLLRIALCGLDSWIYGVPAILAGGYTLWVLVFRKDALSRIVSGTPDVSRSWKSVTAALAAAALTCGLAFNASEFKIWHGGQSMASTQSSLSGPVCNKFDDVLIIQGSPEKETLKLCRALGQSITKDYGFPVRIQSFEEAPGVTNVYRTLPLMVSKAEVIKPRPLNEVLNLPVEFKVSGAPPNYGISRMAGDIRNHHAFRVRILTGKASRSDYFKGVVLPGESAGFDGTFVNASPINVIARTMAENLKPAMTQSRKQPAVRVPDMEMPELQSVELPLDAMKEPVLIFAGRNLSFSAVQVYRFRVDRPEEDMERLSKALEKQGITDRGAGRDGGRRDFWNGDDVKIFAEVRNDGFFSGINTVSKYGMLICTREIQTQGRRREEADSDFLKKFLQDDPRSFAMALGLRTLEGDDLNAAFDRVLEIADLSLNECMIILETTNYEPRRKDLGEKRKKLYRRVADELMKDVNSPDFMSNMKDLFEQGIQTPDNEEHQYLLELISKIYHKVKLPETMDANGFHTLEFSLSRRPVDYSRLLLEIEVPGKGSAFVFAALTAMENNSYKLEARRGSSIRSLESDGKVASVYNSFSYRRGQWFDNVANSIRPPSWPGKDEYQVGHLYAYVNIDRIGSQYDVKIIYVPGEQP